MGFPKRITAEVLRDPARIDRLYQAAVGEGWIAQGEAMRLAVFTLARHATGPAVKNPGGLFAANLRCGRWYGTAADEHWARAAIASLDRETEAVERVPGFGALPAAEKVSREEQLAALAAWSQEGATNG